MWPQAAATTALPVVTPSRKWQGGPGTGFDRLPVDPSRVTAKPAMRLIVPPNQHFTDHMLVGVAAMANDRGTLADTLGLSCVRIHCEGRVVEIAAPSRHSFVDANGTPVSYFGWWAELRHDGRHGHVHVYFEAVPRDPAMQSRVLGPFSYWPQARLHDHQLTIEPSRPEVPGERYRTLSDAMRFLQSVGAANPLVTVREGGEQRFGTLPARYGGDLGWLTIEADEPVVFTNPPYSGDSAMVMRPRYDGLRLKGRNITLDFRTISQFYNEGLQNHWFDGCNIINSAGRYDLVRKGLRFALPIHNQAWLTEVRFVAIRDPAVGCSLARGCTFADCFVDVISDAACAIGCTIRDHDGSKEYTVDVPAFTVRYSGVADTATLSLTGANDAPIRTFTAQWGSNSATFDVHTSEAAYRADQGYTVGHVVAWLNGLNVGFEATLIDDGRRASYCSLPRSKGRGFASADCKAQPLTVVTMVDLHPDFYQQYSMNENVIVADNRAFGVVCQDIFVAGSPVRDYFFVNNAFFNSAGSSFYANNSNTFSQLDKAQSHVVVAHNTLATQQMVLCSGRGYQPDRFCLIAANVLVRLVWTGPVKGDLQIRDNHMQRGPDPAGATGSTFGGDEKSLFADAAHGDFAPRGLLQSNLKLPALPCRPAAPADGRVPAGVLMS